MAIEDLFTKTYSTKRFVTSGGRSDLQQVIAQSHCALQAASPNDPRFIASGVYATHQAFISAADDVRTEDRMYIDGAEFVVIAVADPTGHGHHKEVHLEKKTKS